jgi:inosine/xanthosine triphosphate pyrophosphatase family protein
MYSILLVLNRQDRRVYRTFTKTMKGKNDKMKNCAFCSSLSIIHFQDYNTGNNFYIFGGKGSGQDGRVKEGDRGGKGTGWDILHTFPHISPQ